MTKLAHAMTRRLSIAQMRRVFDRLSYRNARFKVVDVERIVVELTFPGANEIGGDITFSIPATCNGGYRDEAELARHVLAALISFEVHECLERFKFNGKPVFDPHQDARDAFLSMAWKRLVDACRVLRRTLGSRRDF